MQEESKLSPGMQVGDYLLKELISEGTATRTWCAEQVSVKREVIVDSLRSAILQNTAVREAFLEDVRAKARVDHPLIGSVFEAVRKDEICFYARERLAGETLERYIERGDKLAPLNVVQILKQVAEANIYLEQNNIGSIPVGAHQVYIGDKFLTRLVNMAIGELRDHQVSIEDKFTLGSIFKELLDVGQSGATRVNSLCDFMVDRERDIPITWQQIRDLSEQVAKQLREQTVAPGQERTTVSLKDKDLGRNMIIAVVAVVVLLTILFGSAWVYFMPKKSFARELSHTVVVDVPSVEVDGVEVKLGEFQMDAHEVTISEFADFLSDVKGDGMKPYMEKGQPDFVTTYEPLEWATMYKAAQDGLSWNHRKMGVNQPVANVSWWAAAAYANWKTKSDGDYSYSLPTEAEWKAVMIGEKAEALKAGVWGDVDANSQDQTTTGIHGLAGGVSEWSLVVEVSEDGVTSLPVLLGGSYLKPAKGVLSREVVRGKGIRRLDLGFRLVKRAK